MSKLRLREIINEITFLPMPHIYYILESWLKPRANSIFVKKKPLLFIIFCKMKG